MHLCSPTVRTPKRQWRIEFSLLCYSLLWTEPLNICDRLLLVVKVTCNTFFISLCHVNFQPDMLFCKLNYKKGISIKLFN